MQRPSLSATALRPAVVVLFLALTFSCSGGQELSSPESSRWLSEQASATERWLLDVDFDRTDHAATLEEGWSYPEHGEARSFAWGVGAESALSFDLEEPSRLYLHLLGRSHRPRSPQNVEVLFNGELLGSVRPRSTWQVLPDALFVPRELVRAGRNRILLRYTSRNGSEATTTQEPLRLAVAWDRIYLTRPSRVERLGKDLRLFAGDEVTIDVETKGPVELVFDGLSADSPTGSLEILGVPFADSTGGSTLGRISPSSPRSFRLTEGPDRLRLRLLARGEPDSSLRLVAPRLEGPLVPTRPGNLLLVSIDTLRYDHLGVYGYPLPTSPHLDAWARDAIVFDAAIAHGPSTLISHASLFSSLLPQHHKASFEKHHRLSQEVTTLTEVLARAGYRCASYNGGGQLDAVFGIDQGFEVYDSKGGSFRDVSSRGTRWLDSRKDEPFFLFLHTYEVHHPYTPRTPDLARFAGNYTGSLPARTPVELLEQINRGERQLDDADRRYIVAQYDALIRSMDRAFGQLLRFLRSHQLYDSTLVVFTSDHGEEFAEHGWMGWHSHSLYDELIRVPLLVKRPRGKGAGQRLDLQVRHLDVAPTVLDLLGLPVPEGFAGRSLRDVLDEGARPTLPAVGMIDADADYFSIRSPPWKWFHGRLFDLRRDPAEQLDLARESSARARELRLELEALLEAGPQLDPESLEMTDEALERLRALGYL